MYHLIKIHTKLGRAESSRSRRDDDDATTDGWMGWDVMTDAEALTPRDGDATRGRRTRRGRKS